MSTISNIQSDLQVASPYLSWIANIVKAASGSSSNTSTAAATVASTAAPAATASVSLGITSDVGEGFKAVTAITNLVAARSALNNSPSMEQASEAQKIQNLKDYATAVIAHAEETGDMTGIKLLLS